MKILVFSDLHGDSFRAKRAIARHEATADAVFFLGDGLGDIEPLRAEYEGRLSFFMVSGNCDGFFFAGAKPPAVTSVSLDGFRFFLTHGHLYHAKFTLDPLYEAGVEHDADVVLFGHTHIAETRYFEPDERHPRPLWLFNPGSLTRPIEGEPSYGLIETRKGQILLTVVPFSD